jgi:hypothetical protein
MRWSKLVLTPVAVFAFAGTAPAQLVTENPGTQYTTAALTTANTFGWTMLGMTVTGYDIAGNPVGAVWSDLFGNGNAYGAQNTLFTVFLRSLESTSTAIWRLRAGNAALSRIVFSGAPGNTVFDRTFGFVNGTPGSNGGIDFGLMLGDNHNTTATYRNSVGVGGASPVGDIFETLDIVFATPLAAGSFVDYMADTDNAALNSPIVPVTATPEPGGILLLATGLGVIGAMRRRG